MNIRNRLVGCFLTLAFATTSGCTTKFKADYGKLGLIHVSGRVTLDGQPLAKAVITFDDTQDGTFSFGQTDSGGNYRLRFDSDMAGVKPGRKIVRISTTRKILGLNSSEAEGEDGSNEQAGKSESAQELVPSRYNKKSELTADVSASTRAFNFELNSKAASAGGN